MMKLRQFRRPVFSVKKLPLKILKYGSLAVALLLLVSAVIVVLFSDYLINKYVKPEMDKALAVAFPGITIHFSELHYSVWKNRLGCDSLTINAKDTSVKCSMEGFSVSGMNILGLIFEDKFSPGQI